MWYKFFRAIVKGIFFPLFRVKVIGKENLEFEGKMVIYSNHTAAIDPFFIHCMLKRMPHYMAKIELFKNPLFAKIITKLGAFPVDRDHTDMQAVKNAFKILNSGEILGIFPEGKRSLDGKIGEFHTGAAMIALRAKSPMLPIYISRRMKPFCRTYFVVGKPFYVQDKLDEAVNNANTSSVEDATKAIRQEIFNLKEQFESGCLK